MVWEGPAASWLLVPASAQEEGRGATYIGKNRAMVESWMYKQMHCLVEVVMMVLETVLCAQMVTKLALCA